MNRPERLEVARQRIAAGRPAHEPPHWFGGKEQYLITAACYEHACVMRGRERAFSIFLRDEIRQVDAGTIHAWVVLPNHYHVLWEGELAAIGPVLGRLHNRTATSWNRQDDTPGRRVWYRFSDRYIRSQGHYYTTVNYIHYNPVKHGWATTASDWAESSLSDWLKLRGCEFMVALWRRYPLMAYGEAWDEQVGGAG